MFALILGCSASLVPGEVVLGVDIPAEFSYGSVENARYGAALAQQDGHLLIGSPGEKVARLDGEILEGPYEWLGWWEGKVVQADARLFWVDHQLYMELQGASSWGAGPAGLVVSKGGRLLRLDQPWALDVPGIQAVYSGETRILAVVCKGVCAGYAWTPEGVPLGEVLRAGDGGAITEWQGQAWAGDPRWSIDADPGIVCAEDGHCIEGEPGDHIGAAIHGGYTVGMFNKEINPPRQRIVPLEGGTVYVLEEGAELQETTINVEDGHMVVGAPYVPYQGIPSGMVVQTDL